MKNLVKVLGIIAVIAIIGLAVGCSVDPEDQTLITIAGMADTYNDAYASVVVVEDLVKQEILGLGQFAKPIKGGQVKEIALYDEKGAAVVVKQGFIVLVINSSSDLKGTDLYTGTTDKAITLGKGPFTVDAEKFVPDLTTGVVAPPPPNEKIATFKGTYETTYKTAAGSTKNIKETIDLNDTAKFVISDDDNDKLEFKITEWDYADTPSKYATAYPTGFKFVGKILKSTNGYYSATSQTGKGIIATDINENGTGTTCWMYLYFSDDGKVVRTPFSKAGATENTDVVLQYTSGPVREYTKQP